MMKSSFNVKCTLMPFFLFLITFSIFQNNLFGTVDKDFFNSFQKDSETLVVGSIVANELGIDKKGWQLGFIGSNGTFQYPNNIFDSYQFFSKKENDFHAVYVPYHSQVGGQGLFYSTLQNIFSFKSVAEIQYFPSALLSFLVIAFYYINRRIYGLPYSILFSLSLVFSPWFASFARNLYWSPFLWLLPCFFATLAYMKTSPRTRCTLYFLIFLSFFFKSLCGYEYITSIALLACSPFVVGPFFNGESKPKIKPALIVFSLCVCGFLSAFIIHASMRGDTITNGVVEIYKQDIQRRTYSSNPSDFPPSLSESLKAKPISVVINYITSWKTPLITALPGQSFQIMIFIAAVGLFINKKLESVTFTRDLTLITYMFLIPFSWYFLAKGHSYAHPHMNYVLWYLGFVPSLFFVCANTMVTILKYVYNYIKEKVF